MELECNEKVSGGNDCDIDDTRRLEGEANLTLTKKGEAVEKGLGKYKNRD